MVDTTEKWGELEHVEDLESESEDEEDEEERNQVVDGTQSEFYTHHETSGDTPLTVASGLQSYMTSASATPALLDLRKAGTSSTPQLYTVIQQQSGSRSDVNTSAVGTALLMGTSHSYVMPSGRSQLVQRQLEAGRDGVQVALAPEELEQLDEKLVQRRYEAQRQSQLEQHDHIDDDGDDVGEKRRRKAESGSSLKKKFKF
jgi:multidrug efflux pump subunit AcrB